MRPADLDGHPVAVTGGEDSAVQIWDQIAEVEVKWLHRVRRYSHIGRVLLRHGLLPYLRGGRRAELATADGRAQLAHSVRLALDDGGVTFVKLGQVFSTRRDLLRRQQGFSLAASGTGEVTTR